MKKSTTPRRPPKSPNPIRQWMEKYFESLLFFARGLLEGTSLKGEDAEDFVSDVFLKLSVKPIEELLKITIPFAFLKKCVRFRVLNAIKKARKHDKVIANEPSPIIKLPKAVENTGVFVLLQDNIYQLLQSGLTEDEFAIINMLAMGYPYKEASEILEIPVATLRTLAYRGRKKAHNILKRNHLI